MDLSKNRNSPVNTEMEKGPEWIRRARLLDAIELRFANLTAEQEATVDAVCELLPLVDAPMILDLAADRAAVCALLRELPRTHPITRYLEAG